jgi:hypothetical protein
VAGSTRRLCTTIANNGGAYGFQRLDGEVIQHVPILRETWVLAVRGRVETTLNDNDQVPYFLLPALGSGSTLRAFTSDRFRDRHSMLFTGEFRWLPSTAVDMAFFYDAGKVTSRRSDLDFKRLKSDVGIGIRFHGLIATPLRIDLAIGNEGLNLVFSSSTVSNMKPRIVYALLLLPVMLCGSLREVL